jgi:hypothetical protein
VTVSTSDANNGAPVDLNTYPSLFLLGSLFSFGGTGGALVAEYADADVYASDAVAMTADPATGNVLIAVDTDPGRVLAFGFRNGVFLGVFGETASFSTAPVALAFDEAERLFVANTDGSVQRYDSLGRFIASVGDVTALAEQVGAIALSPVSGELLVVDGRAAQPIRRYNPSNGAFLGVLGTVESVATQPVDIAFFATTDLFVADGTGALVRCNPDGTACADVAAATSLLAPGGPTSVAVNPAAEATAADVMIADSVNRTVVACDADGSACAVFGETSDLRSTYLDLTFAPTELPTVLPPPNTTTLPETTTTTDVGAFMAP